MTPSSVQARSRSNGKVETKHIGVTKMISSILLPHDRAVQTCKLCQLRGRARSFYELELCTLWPITHLCGATPPACEASQALPHACL